MDGLTFTATMTGYLAWPVAAVTAAAILRGHIPGLIGRLEKLKAPGIEATFAAEASRLAAKTVEPASIEASPADTNTAVAAPTPLTPESGLARFRVLEPAGSSATGAIVQSWAALEGAIERLAEAYEDDLDTPVRRTDGRFLNSLVLLGAIQRIDILNDSMLESINQLRRMRNEVAHARSFDPPSSAVANYISSANALIYIMSEMAKSHRARGNNS